MRDRCSIANSPGAENANSKETAQEAGAKAGSDQQLAFLREPEASGAEASSPTREQLALADDIAPRPRGPGRPPGAVNKATRDLVSYLQAQDALPGIALAKIVKAGHEELAKQLGCTNIEAYDRWLRALDMLLPYAHPRLASVRLESIVNNVSEMHLLAVQAISRELANAIEADPAEPDP